MPRPCISLSKRYWKGDGVPPDSAKSTEYLKKAADKGYAPAQNDLGAFYAKRKKHAEAAKWYRKAAEQGDNLGPVQSGPSLLAGAWCGDQRAGRSEVAQEGRAEKPNQRGGTSRRDLYERWARAQLGPTTCLPMAGQGRRPGKRGRLLFPGQALRARERATRNLHAAVSCYIQAAEKGEARAPRRLSELSVPDSEWKSDIIEAIKWLRVAIMHGDLDANRAMNNLGARFEVSGEQDKEACRRALDFERANGRELGKQEEQELNRSKQR